jgi:hypothetical protein
MPFGRFEVLITKVSSQLQVLTLSTFDHSSYLDANLWEQLISLHMPHLQKFHFQHRESSDNKYQVTLHHPLINQFTSPFWTDRQWIFEITINGLDFLYSIQPYRYLEESYTLTRDFFIFFRKRWFEFDKLDNQSEMQRTDIINPSIQSDENVHLTVTCYFTHACIRLLIDKIN